MVDSLRVLRRGLFLYRRNLGAVIRSVLEYAADFWILIVAGIVTQSLGLVFITVVMARVPQINGWSFPEMVFIYALAVVSSSVVPPKSRPRYEARHPPTRTPSEATSQSMPAPTTPPRHQSAMFGSGECARAPSCTVCDAVRPAPFRTRRA